MKPERKRAAMTAKQRVRNRHPKAWECYTRSGEKAVGVGLNTILGIGKTWKEAWIEAAAEKEGK